MLTRKSMVLASMPVAIVGYMASASEAQAQNIITLRSTRASLLSNGRDSINLIAEIRDITGRPFTGNALVRFSTTLGNLSSVQAQAFGGIAQVTLRSSVAGTAQVVASAPNAGVSQPLEVVCTNDPEAMFQGNNYVSIQGSSYLAYSATLREVS